MTIRIQSILQTCKLYPSQWDAWTDTGDYLYLHYRFGKGKVCSFPTPNLEDWSLTSLNNPLVSFTWCDCPDKSHPSPRYPGRCFAGEITLIKFCELAQIELMHYEPHLTVDRCRDDRFGPELGPWLAGHTTQISKEAYSYWNSVCNWLSSPSTEYDEWRALMIQAWGHGTRP